MSDGYTFESFSQILELYEISSVKGWVTQAMLFSEVIPAGICHLCIMSSD